MCIWVKIVNPQNESTSMDYWKLKLKATKFGWFLGTTIQTILYLGPICSGHWQSVTSPHPDTCPTSSSASLLLSSSSRASRMHAGTLSLQNHRNWMKLIQEKETAICKKKLQKTCSAERWWNIVTCICTVLQFEQKWDLAPDAGVILIVFFVASICPQDITGCHVAISTNT